MSPHIVKLSEALSLLELSEDCSIEELKVAYRQHALRTHPDKNPGNPEATAEFQRVGEAYKIIETHLERPKYPRGGYYTDEFDPFFTEVDIEDVEDFFYDYSGSEDYEYDYSDDDDDNDGSGSEHAYYRMPQSFMDYLFLFEAINSGHYRCDCPRHGQESYQEQQVRLRRSRGEQVDIEFRRTAEATAHKEHKAKERELERAAAERRQKVKAEQKKSQAEAHRKRAEETVRAQRKRAQELRSGVFAAVRNGDVDKVKNGIWKDGVDAAGGEIKYEELVERQPEDPLETLLHITAKKGDVELFQWLDAHNAEMDEQDSRGYTALHFAMYHGYIPIVKHVFDNYFPKESEYKKIYDTPACSNLLHLAIKSGEPELVWVVLENGLFDTQDMDSGWKWATQAAETQGKSNDSKDGKHPDILKLLMRYGGFTPPLTAAGACSQEGSNNELLTRTKRNSGRGRRGQDFGSHRTSLDHKERQDNDKSERPSQSSRGRGRRRGRGRGQAYDHKRGKGRGHTSQTSS